MHTSGSSGGEDEEERTTAELLGRPLSGAAATSRMNRYYHHHRRRRQGLVGRATQLVRSNWKLLVVGKLAVVLVLTLLGAHHYQHASQQAPPQPTGPDRLSTQPAPAAAVAASSSDGEAGARPRYSVWGHGYRLFHSLRQRWKTREAPPHQSVSVAPDTDGDNGAPARRCAPPKPHKGGRYGEEGEGLHNRAFFLGGQAFDRVPPPPMASLRPRGVVIAATGTVERLAVGAYITAFLIRRVFGSQLPIEIYHVSDRERFAPELKRQLEALGDVRVIDLVTALQERFGDVLAAEAAETHMREQGHGQGEGEGHEHKQQLDSHMVYLKPSIEQLASYASKAYAMLVSSFREAVLFDAGAVPFQDPDNFFGLDDYRRSGFLVFRDYVEWTPHKWDWMAEEFCVDTAAIHTFYAGTEGDSSCVMMDKVRSWDALLVAAILNGPLQHTTYQKLNGDKDTWVMAMLYAGGGTPLPPLHTVPGFLFVDYEGNFVGRKVHGQLQMLKVDDPEEEQRQAKDKKKKQQQQQEDEQAGGLLVPLYFNNQLFNFTQWQWNKGWTYVGSYDDYGSIYNPPHSLAPDCRPYPIEHLEPLTEVMNRAFDGVVEALKTIGSKHCGCRDDWPSACVTFIY
jgi:hypothetical protein